MSDKERRPKADGGGGGGGGGDDEKGEGPTNQKDRKCNGCGKKVRRLSLFRLRRRKQRGVSVNSGCGGGWSCLKPPRTVGSSGESPTSDPNSSEFTFDMLRGLIEKNDFYSKECNPHLDLDEDSLVREIH